MKLLEKFLLILGYFKYPITYMLAPKCSRLLYVGLGDGMDAIRVGRRASELVGVDISPVMAKICKYNIKSKKPRVLEAGLPIIKEAILSPPRTCKRYKYHCCSRRFSAISR
jgi:hypothetical protein